MPDCARLKKGLPQRLVLRIMSRGSQGDLQVAGLGQSGTIVIGGDGAFRALPAKRALTDSAVTGSAEKFRITTVFAADGRYVHLRKPMEEKEPPEPSSRNKAPSRPSSSEPAARAPSAPTALSQGSRGSRMDFPDAQTAESRRASDARGVWTVQQGGCIEVRVPQTATGSGLAVFDSAKDVPHGSGTPKPKESWLDSRLKHAQEAQAQPIAFWSRRGAQQEEQQEGLEDAASASLEVKISKRSPTSFKESSASLKIRAPSMQMLDRIILDSVDGLVSEMRPVLS
ncbi:unnamed protein product [Symbiodinium natans]|uniref:Uncharacterized protein n=1 Tax=Symbiodinium natans TaxID=878477 RepID=A0A812RWY7_9DINO|nr:unnamed protein product [Symbiodinium natans]